MNLTNQLLEIVDKRQISDRQLSMLATGSTDTIRNIRRGSSPRADTLEALCRALGLEFYIGPPRDGSAESASPPPPSPAIPPDITDLLGLPAGADADTVVIELRKALTDKCAAAANPVAPLDKRTLERTLGKQTRALEALLSSKIEHLLLPDDEAQESRKLALREVHDVQAAAGSGEEIFEEGTETTLIVSADDIPPGLKTDRLVGIRATGCSMEPTIHTDDILILNLDATEPREGAIFVVRTDTGLVVKRLCKKAGIWTMTSDNADWEPRPVKKLDRIVGHVVWFGPEGVIVGGVR